MPTWSLISPVPNLPKWCVIFLANGRTTEIETSLIADPVLQVYEKGCASITNSVDLWTDYCSFTMETTHDPHLVRE